MPDQEIVSPFEIKIDFQRDSPKPSRVFHAMSGLIDSFEELDRTLLIPFGLRVEPILLLHDVESGSVRSKMASILKSTDDEAIKSLDWKKLLGAYLLRAKYWILKKLEEKKEIATRSELLEITNGINDLVKEADILHLPAYKPMPPTLILRAVKHTTQSLTVLGSGDSASYIAEQRIVEFNTAFVYRPEMEQILLTESTRVIKEAETIKVKKPDYLGESMWQFRHRGHLILARMEDHDWILQFQTNRVKVEPGDALRVILETTLHYDEDGVEIAANYKVLKVDEVIISRSVTTSDLFEEE